MRKIPRLFLPSGKEDGTGSSEIDPQCYWVLNYGYPTRKFDGTCCLVLDGKLYARRQVKLKKAASKSIFDIAEKCPRGFVPFYIGHQRMYGWVAAHSADNCKKHRQYLQERGVLNVTGPSLYEPEPLYLEDGTYELCGPGVNGNNDRFPFLQLVKHGAWAITDLDYRGLDPRDLYEKLKTYLTDHPFEGIVFKGPSGLYTKICRQHFGLPWPVK